MQNTLIAFLAGMAVMYLLSSIRWRKLQRRLGKRWQHFATEWRRAQRKRKHS